MTYIDWSDGLSVGNAFIDHDHRKPIRKINHLRSLVDRALAHAARTAGAG